MAAGRARTRAFHAPSDFAFPDVGAYELVTSGPERATAVHFDTEDLRLTRRGIDVRYVHATPGPGTWVLRAPRKLTATPSATPHRARQFTGGPTTPPVALVAAVRCCLGPKKLAPVARTRTDRRSTTVVDGEALVATVHHDQLSLLEGRRAVVRADELQLEPGPRTAGDAVDEIERLLRSGGADDLRAPSTLAAMLGTRASIAPGPAVPSLTRRSSFADAVQASLATNVHALLHHLPLVHLGAPVTGVHQSRVAVRRYRSHLRTFAPLLDEDRRADVDARLAELARAMGPARELDVLVESLTTAVARVTDRDRPGALALVEWFDGQRPPLRAGLLEVLGGDATAGAATAAVTFASAPPITERGDEPARLVLTDLARRAWRRAARLANQLDAHSPTEQLHDLRILVKRARYAALAAVPVRPEAAPHARALARLQDALGEINDISITEERVLTAVASGLGPDAAYAAGLIVAAERRRSERRRAAWPQLWDEARRKRVRAWLDSAE